MTRLSRRVLASLSLVTLIALLGVLFIMVNYLASRRYARWDVTRQQITALSDQTVQTLKSLNEPVSITVFYQPTHRLYELVKDLLEEYTRVSPNVHVEYVDPEQDIARAKQLAQQFQIDDLNIVVFQAGSRHKYLSDTELAEYDYGAMRFGAEARVKTFKGEDAFTSAIINVTHADSTLIWLTSGHGEKSIDTAEPTGYSDLKKSLEQQNMSVKTMALLGRATIPPEVKLIIIAGPTRRFTEPELLALQTYLEQGGRLLALIDPMDDSGLDGLLERWGVNLGMNIVVDPSQQLPFVSAANLFVTDYTRHPIVEKMKTLATLFPLARSVGATDSLPPGVIVTPLALTSTAGWGETTTSVSTFEYNAGQDLKGPVSIAVAVERSHPTRTRMVVIGDSDFAINSQLPNAGNRDLILGALYWLIEQERLIGIGPKALESIKLSLTSGQLTSVFWFSFLTMPLLCGAAGAAVWWVRRK